MACISAIQPQESREIEVQLRSLLYVRAGEQFNLEANVSHGWMDLTLYVTYRDRDGFLREVRDYVTVGT